MKKLKVILRYIVFFTIILFFIYFFYSVKFEEGNAYLFAYNSYAYVPQSAVIARYIFISVYAVGLLCGIIFILVKKQDDVLNDRRQIDRLDMHMPTADKYNLIKDNARDVFVRCCNTSSFGLKFFISDLNGNLLYKIKQKNSIPVSYIVSDPFDNVLADIRGSFFELTPGFFEVNIINNESFTVKKLIKATHTNYVFDNLPMEIIGDFWGIDYIISDINNGQVLAEISTTDIDGWSSLGNADITFHDNKYMLEIICGIVCSLLGQIKIERRSSNS